MKQLASATPQVCCGNTYRLERERDKRQFVVAEFSYYRTQILIRKEFSQGSLLPIRSKNWSVRIVGLPYCFMFAFSYKLSLLQTRLRYILNM